MPDRDSIINDLYVAKRIICNPQMHTPEMCIRIGQSITSAIALLKEQGHMTPEEFKDGLLKMFSSIWECEIDHPMFQDTIGELMDDVMQLYKKAVKWDG